MDVKGVVENDLKWIMIASGRKNESWDDDARMKAMKRFFLCLSLSNLNSNKNG